MGSAGMKRKSRHRPPKASDEGPAWGTVALGQDPPVGPWGPMGRIQAYGNVAQAWNNGTPRQRRAARVILAVVALPGIAAVVSWIASALPD